MILRDVLKTAPKGRFSFMSTRLPRDVFIVALLLFAAGLVLQPGLSGIYLLDDGPNLKVLANLSAHDGMPSLLSHALGQISGATRILPGLSFALQREAWPDRPGYMILVNLCIHLFNGILVYTLAGRLAVLRRMQRPALVAILAASIWLLHPIQVSGTLYIVQRINQMSALFVLSGTLVYLHGRTMVTGRPVGGLAWMSAGLVVFGGLAFASKENGALMPLLILVLEGTLLGRETCPAACRWWRVLFLIAPVIFLVGVLVWNFEVYVRAGYGLRDFTLLERLLTECRALTDYLSAIVFPRASGLGLMHDDYPITHWPPGTADAASIVFVIGLLVTAIILRKRFPVAAFGVLWFFSGHAMESTIVPLELYFEHRNYLPLFGLALAGAAGFARGFDRVSGIVRFSLAALGASWILVAVWTTHQEARLWGVPSALAAVWAHEHPDSARARLFEAGMLNLDGFKAAAARSMADLAEGKAARTEYYAEWMLMACDGKMAQRPDVARVAEALRRAKVSVQVIGGISKLADIAEEGHCPAYSGSEMASLADALLDNPRYADREWKIRVLRGRLQGIAGQWRNALDDFRWASSVTGNPEIAFLEVRALVALNRFPEAVQRLVEIERMVASGGLRYRQYRSALVAWKRKVAND